jgi:hypothetical protein
LNPDDGTLEFSPTLREKALELMNKIEDVKAGRLKVTEKWMSSLWHSGIQNTQDVAGATGWCRGSMPSRETSIAIEAAKEEKSTKRIIGAK